MNTLNLKDLNTVTPKNLKTTNEVTRITMDLAKKSIGKKVIFLSCGKFLMREVLGVSSTGKTINVDYPKLKNNLQTGRAIYILKDI